MAGGEVVAGIAMPEGDPGAIRDAAGALRRVGGGFGHVAGTVDQAAASVPTWQGIASMQFLDRCTDYEGAARGADGACGDAAHAVEAFAGQLAEARRRIGRMQQHGAHLEKVAHDADHKVELANGRLRTAEMIMRQGMLESAADFGATLDAARTDADAAITDIGHWGGVASRARTELDGLRRDAARIREQVEHQAHTAAARVWAACDELPTVVGAPGGSVGGTPVNSHAEKFDVGITIVIFHIGGDTAVIKEHTIDGKWRVTQIDGVEGGLEFDPVPGAGVDDGSGKIGRLGAGLDVEAAFLAQYKHGKTYEFSSEDEADRFIEWKDKYVPDSPESITPPGSYLAPYELNAFYMAKRFNRWALSRKPVETFSEGGARVEADVSAGDVASGSGEAEEAVGTRTDDDTGVRTTYYRTGASLAGDVGLPISAGGKVSGEAITAITRDPSGRPTAYSVTLSGAAEGSAGAHATLDVGEHGGGGLDHHETGGVRVEKELTLDLNDPANRRAVDHYLSSPGDPDATAELSERLHQHARVDVREYDTGSTSSGANIDVKVIKIEGHQTTEDSRLTVAEHHAPGGPMVTTTP